MALSLWDRFLIAITPESHAEAEANKSITEAIYSGDPIPERALVPEIIIQGVNKTQQIIEGLPTYVKERFESGTKTTRDILLAPALGGAKISEDILFAGEKTKETVAGTVEEITGTVKRAGETITGIFTKTAITIGIFLLIAVAIYAFSSTYTRR